ncbi:MAG: hypothetical protein ACTSU3_03315, partial [Candidatus Thorarchaeota archaeon]
MRQMLKESITQIRIAMSSKRSKAISTAVSILYLVFYLAITGILTLNFETGSFSFFVSENWMSLILRERAPFNWEPIGILSLGILDIYLAVPNIIFGLIVGTFVGINIAISAHTYKTRNLCKINPSSSILTAIPALLTGVACCGPTFLLSIGIASATLTIAFVSILPLLFPIAIIGLILSLFWSGWRLSN